MKKLSGSKLILFLGIFSMLLLFGCVSYLPPGEVIENTCAQTSGISVISHNISKGSISFDLSNKTDGVLKEVVIDIIGKTAETEFSGNTTLSELDNSNISSVEIALNPEPATNSKYDFTVSFEYTDRDGLLRTVTTTCLGVTQ